MLFMMSIADNCQFSRSKCVRQLIENRSSYLNFAKRNKTGRRRRTALAAETIEFVVNCYFICKHKNYGQYTNKPT
jgi:hypothetical protein